jgi:outer membrane protein
VVRTRTPAHRFLLFALTALPLAAQGEGLLELYDQAMTTNPVLRGREFNVEQARAQKDLARSRLLPQIGVDASYDWNAYDERNAPTEYYDGKRGSIVASQPLLDLSSYYRYKGAKLSVEQSEHERNAAEMELASDLVDRYLIVLQAEDEIAYLQAEKAAIESQLKRLRLMRERQLAKVTDLYEVEAYYQGLLTREIEARNAREIALEQLRETTGVDVRQVAPLAREEFPAVPGDEEQWTRDALETNPGLLALAKAIEAAERLVDSGHAEHLPRVSLSASQVYADQGFDNRAVQPYDVGSVGILFNLPLYEGGRVNATVREASARLQIAREEYEAARREIERRARTAYLSALASYARIRSTGAETEALEKVVEAQLKSYEFRVTTILDVLIARRRLTKAQSDESKARYEYIRDLTTLRAQVGELNRPHIEQIDSWLADGTALPAGR